MWTSHIYLKYDNVLFVWSGECGHHIFILNTATFCLFDQENVDSTYLSLIRQRIVCLIRRMWTAHIYLKYDNVLFVWSGECGHHIFIFNTTTFCLFGQENVDITYLS